MELIVRDKRFKIKTYSGLIKGKFKSSVKCCVVCKHPSSSYSSFFSKVQYTDKIKSIVEFLGPNLSADEIRSIWSLGEEDSSHVMDNVHRLESIIMSFFCYSE